MELRERESETCVDRYLIDVCIKQLPAAVIQNHLKQTPRNACSFYTKARRTVGYETTVFDVYRK
jgi:hypothetical protein